MKATAELGGNVSLSRACSSTLLTQAPGNPAGWQIPLLQLASLGGMFCSLSALQQ